MPWANHSMAALSTAQSGNNIVRSISQRVLVSYAAGAINASGEPLF
jgi:hypothetical protein